MVSVRQKKRNRALAPKIRRRPKTKASLRNPRGNAIIAANWDNSATLTQNYERLGLVAKLNSRSGGRERRIGGSTEMPEEPLLVTPSGIPRGSGKKGAAAPGTTAAEVKVERDPVTGAILRILADSTSSKKDRNPLNDPLRELDESEDEEDFAEFGAEDDGHGSARALKRQSHPGRTPIARELQDEADLAAPRRPRQQSEREKDWVRRLVDVHGDNYTRMARDRKLNPMQQTEADIRKRVRAWRAAGS